VSDIDERWLYAWAVASVGFGTASLLVPLYLVGLGGGPTALGIQAAVAALFGTLGAFLWGRLADRTGAYRRLLGIALIATMATFLVLPLLGSLSLIIVASGVVWFAFSAAGPVLTVLVVADVEEHRWERRIAALNAYQGYGWAGGLVLGAAWSSVTTPLLAPLTAQRWLLVLCGVLTAASTALMLRWLPATETDPEEDIRRASGQGAFETLGFSPRLIPSDRSRVLQRIRRPPVRETARRVVARFTPLLTVYFGAVVLFFAGFGVFFAPLPAYLTTAGYDSGGVFALYVVAAVASALTYMTAGRLTSEYNHVPFFHAGALSVRGLSLPMVAVVGTQMPMTVPGFVVMCAAFAVLGLSWAFIAVTGSSLVTRLAPASIRGEAFGAYLALSAAAGGIGNLAGGWLADTVSYTVCFAVAAALVLLGALVVFGVRVTAPEEASRSGSAAN
jgi:MFS family permease